MTPEEAARARLYQELAEAFDRCRDAARVALGVRADTRATRRWQWADPVEELATVDRLRAEMRLEGPAVTPDTCHLVSVLKRGHGSFRGVC